MNKFPDNFAITYQSNIDCDADNLPSKRSLRNTIRKLKQLGYVEEDYIDTDLLDGGITGILATCDGFIVTQIGEPSTYASENVISFTKFNRCFRGE